MKTFVYWATTLTFCALILLDVAQYVMAPLRAMQTLERLGYPNYLVPLLSFAKVLGAGLLLVPRVKLPKEWAYAGFAFALVGRVVSHFAINETNQALIPSAALLVLMISYFTRPASRTVLHHHHIHRLIE